MTDPYGYHAFAVSAERLRVAEQHRPRRRATRRLPSPAVRVSTRIWWASRPRAGAWAPALLDPGP